MAVMEWLRRRESAKREASLSLEEVVSQRISRFFERLGETKVEGVRRAVLDEVERPLIRECLEWTGGNQLKAARALGINRNTLRKRMKELGIVR